MLYLPLELTLDYTIKIYLLSVFVNKSNMRKTLAFKIQLLNLHQKKMPL